MKSKFFFNFDDNVDEGEITAEEWKKALKQLRWPLLLLIILMACFSIYIFLAYTKK